MCKIIFNATGGNYILIPLGREPRQVFEVKMQNHEVKNSNVSGFTQKNRRVSGQITGIRSIANKGFSSVPEACSRWAEFT